MRADVYSRKAMVATSSMEASLAAQKIINNGGNVFDAAIAASATLCVTQNNLCGLGGDGFVLIRKDGKIKALNGSGKSSKNANIEMFREKGITSIPSHGPMSALTVPGLPSLMEKVFKDYCSMELKELLNDPVKLAIDGRIVTEKYAESANRSAEITQDRYFKSLFQPNGRLKSGDLLRQPDLGKFMQSLIENGLNSYYDGYALDILMKGIENTELILEDDDFRRHKILEQKPLKSLYRNNYIYELPPNSQGAIINLWLKLFEEEKTDVASWHESYEKYKTGLIAYEFRKKFIGDPEKVPFPENFLDENFISNMMEEKNGIFNAKNGDTTYFTIGDSDGNAVSWIQSNYMGFGSLVGVPGTGIVMQNRGSYFTLDEKHHNRLEPEKRTFHTLCATMIENEGDLFATLGTMGGDIQPIVNFDLINGILIDGMTPQQSIDRPRGVFNGTIYSDEYEFLYEEGFEPQNEVLKMFKRIRKINYGSSLFGHAQAITYKDGILTGGADPRGDGYAIPVI
ncbi:gamma-glutamyltransferase family protein [Caldiplasma sukawensis]